MDSTWINAPAKINIGLDVLRRREDGYHEVKMIMQSIRLFDRLTLEKTDKPGMFLSMLNRCGYHLADMLHRPIPVQHSLHCLHQNL